MLQLAKLEVSMKLPTNAEDLESAVKTAGRASNREAGV